MKKEEAIQIRFCNYLKKNHPSVLFTADLSGENVSIHQARKNKMQRSNRGFPDLMIFERNDSFGMLFLEFKKESPYLKNGKLSTNKHIQEQNQVHEKLREKGYKVEFVWSLESAILIIENYIK